MTRRATDGKTRTLQTSHFHQCTFCNEMRRLWNVQCRRYRSGVTCIEVCQKCVREVAIES